MEARDKASLLYQRSCQSVSVWQRICREVLFKSEQVLAGYGYKISGHSSRVAAYRKDGRRLWIRTNESRILAEIFPLEPRKGSDSAEEKKELFALADLILFVDGGTHE